MIETQDLSKQFNDFWAVDGVTLSVKPGQILALLGQNGAGKSTIMRILSCFLPATSGTVKVAGYDVFTQPDEVRRRIGYMPENVPLYPEMTVRAYLDFVGRAKQVSNREDAVEWAMDAARVDHYVRDLPGPPAPWRAFTRFPTWMWRNREVAEFTHWLRAYNVAPAPLLVNFLSVDFLISPDGATHSVTIAAEPSAWAPSMRGRAEMSPRSSDSLYPRQ